MDPAQKETATMKTLEITLPVTETTETVDVLTPAVGRARFASLWSWHFPATRCPRTAHLEALGRGRRRGRARGARGRPPGRRAAH